MQNYEDKSRRNRQNW